MTKTTTTLTTTLKTNDSYILQDVLVAVHSTVKPQVRVLIIIVVVKSVIVMRNVHRGVRCWLRLCNFACSPFLVALRGRFSYWGCVVVRRLLRLKFTLTCNVLGLW